MTEVASIEDVRRGEAEVWARLDRVDDPELDEPITELGFVERVTVSGAGEVEVAFRLPTYWCSPNFAFLMAEDIHREVSGLAWAARVSVRLQDHMWGEEIAAGVNAGRSFAEVFGGARRRRGSCRAAGEVRGQGVQATPGGRAAGLRQRAGPMPRSSAMDLATLDALAFAAEAARQKPATASCCSARGLAAQPDDRAFRTLEGEALTAERAAGLPRRAAEGPDQHGVQRRLVPWARPCALPGDSASAAGADAGRFHAGPVPAPRW